MILIFTFNLHLKGLPIDTIKTLDSFFARVPIKEGFTKWVEYLYKHLYLGLDSANSRESFSSMKPGIKSRFPFPDSVQVKILAEDVLAKEPGIDTLIRYQELLIEGVFGNETKAEKNAWKCYEEIKKMPKKKYKTRTDYTSFIRYSDGINANFPPCILQVDYSKELGFYYVIITAGADTKLPTTK